MTRETLTQIAKMTLAAVAAWAIAEQIHPPQSFIAPYAAVFVISETVYRSLVQIGRQLVVVVLGIVLAFGVAATIQYSGAALAVAVAVGMLIGQWRRLGDDGIWVGTIALLMLTYGTADDPAYLYHRIVESLVGVSVGAVINILVFPPVQLRQAHRVVGQVSDMTIALLTAIGDGLRDGWDHETARSWQHRSQNLQRDARGAEESASRGYESTRFNLRRLTRSPRAATPHSYVAAVSVLSDVNTELRRIADALVTATDPHQPDGCPSGDFNGAFAELLDDLATALERYRHPLGPHDEQAEAGVRHGVRRAAQLRRQIIGDGGDHLGVQGMLVLAANRAFHRLRDENQDG
ncbi:FUSC family protein [Stackebrandtia nassauensis]|uniref:Membrane protein-like protein n=1 Tax=Stackebrandtia nassauensis (strain DSM 44728 / CIP 108903 / NRRL B-16338 / NBRC 102104 / LLR-40K-21) TaxID=446470 RepID=D3QBW8_STANL|nr:aromatic acid exporter family protein [Stackebrandtia nassauensis]ADD44857.1 membrane protein-like protein [Stackebrandtia nassauensis DSM 44728]